MEINGVNEVVHVAESSSGVLHPLDARIDGFTGSIGDSMSEERDDVFKSPFEHSRNVDDRLEPTSKRPLMPPMKMTPRRLFIDVME